MNQPARIAIVVGLGIAIVAGLLLFRGNPGGVRVVTAGPPDARDGGLTPRVETVASGDAGTRAADGGVAAGPVAGEAGLAVRAKWGSGAGELGRDRPKEGNPEAPMSLTVDGAGRVVVLDQVNGRLVRWGAGGPESLPLPLQAPQDVAVARNGTMVVLDRLVDKAIALVDPSGRQLGEIKLEGKGVPEGGAVTAVITDGDDVYVEREHGELVRVGDVNGAVDEERPEVPGRPTHDGKSWVNAGITDGPTGRVRVTALDRETGDHRYTRELRLGVPVMAIVLLDSDAEGYVYLGFLSVAEAAEGAEPEAKVILVALHPSDGRPVGREEVPANTSPDETFREFSVRADGTIVFLQRDETGAVVREVRLR